MKKGEILALLESDLMVEEQEFKLPRKPVNIGRLDGIVYNPDNHDFPFPRF